MSYLFDFLWGSSNSGTKPDINTAPSENIEEWVIVSEPQPLEAVQVVQFVPTLISLPQDKAQIEEVESTQEIDASSLGSMKSANEQCVESAPELSSSLLEDTVITAPTRNVTESVVDSVIEALIAPTHRELMTLLSDSQVSNILSDRSSKSSIKEHQNRIMKRSKYSKPPKPQMIRRIQAQTYARQGKTYSRKMYF